MLNSIRNRGMIMVEFGAKLKALRLASGLTQKQLAERLGITTSVVSYYELSERSPLQMFS